MSTRESVALQLAVGRSSTGLKKGLMGTPFRQQPRIIAQPELDDFPQLLDNEQWTQSATFSQSTRYSGPSDRIGRYYRQGLNELDREGLEQKRTERKAPASPLRPTIERKGWAAGLPCRPLLDPLGSSSYNEIMAATAPDMSTSALGILQRQREEREDRQREPYAGTRRTMHLTEPEALSERMAAYVQGGIDDSSLAPYNDAWMDAAMEQVPTELAGVEHDQVDIILQDMVQEVQDGYFEGVKQSMVEYVLKSSVEGKRIEITRPTQKFELTTFHPSQDWCVADCAAPTSHDSLALGHWHDSVLSGFESIERGLAINHEGMLTMLELWSNYEPLRLCTLTSLPQLAAMELDSFKDMQHTHCERVVQTLKKKWFPAVLDIFRLDSPKDDDELSPTLLSAVSILMYNQLRELLRVSIEDFVAFVEAYQTKADDEFADESNFVFSDDVRHRPLFNVKMQVEGETYSFSPSLPTMLKAVLGIIDHFVAMLNTIPRIESELGKGVATGGRLLTVATPDEEVVTAAKARLQEIIDLNFTATATMQNVYEPYAYLLSADTEKKVVDFNNEKRGLSEITSEIAKYDKARKDVEKRSLPDVRFNLLTVSCGTVKTKLATRAQELADKMRHAVSQSSCANMRMH